MPHVSVGVVQHLTWHLASHKKNMVMFNSAYKVWSVAFKGSYLFDIKHILNRRKDNTHSKQLFRYSILSILVQGKNSFADRDLI